MKASLVTYDGRELHKNLKIKIIKYGYVKDCPKRPTTQIGLIEILGVKLTPRNLTPKRLIFCL
jgi:hypothetical protein